MMQRVRWAWGNLWRKPLRSSLLVASTAITAAILFLSYFFLLSVDKSLTASEARFGADVMVVPKSYSAVAEQVMISGDVSPFYMSSSVLDKLRRIPEVKQVSPQLFLATYSGVCCQIQGDFSVVAFDPGSDFTLKGFVSEVGRSLTPDSILIGSEAGGKNAIAEMRYKTYHERLNLFGHEFEVAQVLFPTGTGADRTIFMSLDTARTLDVKAPQDSISVALVKTSPGDEEYVKRQIERTMPEVAAVTGTKIRETINRQLRPMRLLSYAMIGVVLMMAALQAMTLFSALVQERMREIGMFRAVGAGKWAVYRLMLTEAGLAAFVGGGVGVFLVATTLFDNQSLMLKAFALPLVFPTFGSVAGLALLALAVTVGISMLAASLPTRQILRRNPYDAIREGE
ncbi:ABC transporter permease [Tumebacillus sp. ITR2]|uniref:Putative hemin transport system permease protein HrtB n=1 Tax=Tumebacillus amylolyticus TaxID=2801339 RepID=A0ABS1J9X5_9BACL|nr:ABC transporter permease [Tumebacillus amylolyticus]MBL0387078.1 ABC transporter permease [Tumebacillus amylolyticus]